MADRDPPELKPVVFVGSALKELKEFPQRVREITGYALYLAQCGDKHPHTKPLRGFSGAGVLEVAEQFDGNAYRTVYTVRYARAIYVLHAFQKKSTHGIATPEREMDLVRARLREAEEDYRERFA